MGVFARDIVHISQKVAYFLLFIVSTFVVVVLVVYFFLSYGGVGIGVINETSLKNNMKETQHTLKEPPIVEFQVLDEIGDDDFKYYKWKDGRPLSVLSDFKQKEDFVCSGTCICETDSNRRAVGSTFWFGRKVVFYLGIRSGISYIAYELAKKHFQISCEASLSETCIGEDTIRGEVDECEPLSRSESDSRLDRLDNQNINDEEKIKYWCNGKCLPNYRLLLKSLQGGHDPMELNRIINYAEKKCITPTYMGEVEALPQEKAEILYESFMLGPACNEYGLEKYPAFMRENNLMEFYQSGSALCTSSNDDQNLIDCSPKLRPPEKYRDLV